MSNGFSTGTELQVEAIVRRLSPCCRRKDNYAFRCGLRQMKGRYSEDVLDEALR
jgi:hypothetical protein